MMGAVKARLGEEEQRRKVANLDIVHLPKPGFEKKYALLGTEFGSIDLDFTSTLSGKRSRIPAGVAHFLEHKMFEKEDGDVMDRFAELGCSSNAMTSFNYTGYLIECTDRFDESLETLVDFVTRPYFTDELVKKERGIIAEEIKMYRDDPGWRGFGALLENLFRKHPIRVDIAGTLESIEEIDADTLTYCHQSFYRPENMRLAVSGDVDLDRVAEIVESTLDKNVQNSDVSVERHRPVEGATPKKRRSSEKVPLSVSKLFLGWKFDTTELSGREVMEREVSLDLFLGGLFDRSSDLYSKLYQRGLLDDSFSFSVYSEREFGFVTMSGDTPDPAALERALLQAIEEESKKPLSGDDIGRMRRKAFGSYLRSFNSVEAICWNASECLNKGISYLDYGDLVENLSDRKVRSISRSVLRKDRCASHALLAEKG